MNRKIWKALGIAVCMLALAAPRAMAKTHWVGSDADFKKAVEEINKLGDEKNEIILTKSFTLEGNTTDYTLTNDKTTTTKTTTIKGEGYTITISMAGITVTGEKTVLNLGADGYDQKLTIERNTGFAAITVSGGATANMYEHVTLQDLDRQSTVNACVKLEGNSVFNMHGGVIQNCKSQYSGGLYADKSTVTISGGTIRGCEGNLGGGLYAKNFSTIKISGGEISRCTAGTGGGLYADRSTITISGGIISGCDVSTGAGGGLYADKSTVTISGGTISECSAGTGGGLYAINQSTLNISNGTIENNRAAYGGGVALIGSTINPITHWTVDGNKADNTGGGIYLENVLMDVSDGSNHIYNNTADGHGADIFLYNGKASIKLPNAANMDVNYRNSGMKIDGWYKDNPKYNPSESGVAVNISGELNGGGDDNPNGLSLVASYKTTCTVTIDANGGVGGSVSQTVHKGTNVTLEAPTKEGHLFKGWKDEKGNSYPAGEDGKVKITVTGAMTLTAVWEARTFTVTYVLLDGKTRTETAAYGQNVTLGEEPRTGYTFVGWKDGEKMRQAGETITVTEDKTLTAVWDARTFTVTYVLLDGKTRTETAAYGQNVTLGEEPRTGYTFVGWKDGENVYQAGETITVTGDMTLTAEWKKLPSAENLPKTGDESPVLLWGAALAVSAAACFMLRRRK